MRTRPAPAARASQPPAPPADRDTAAAGPLAPDDARVTPMMAQYLEIKAANPDSLLFYRMGDFYELFFADAETASRALGIVLTKRGKHAGADIPMCGVPVERADDYLQRLIALGHRVAVCEQTEDPAEARKRGNKSVVRRDVVRLVTPGTITEDNLLDPARANLLVAVARRRLSDSASAYGLAAIDISTGRFLVSETDTDGLAAEIARLDPREIVLPEAVHDDPALADLWRETRAAVTPLAREGLDPASAERRIKEVFGVAALDAFGTFSRAEIAAAGSALLYIERTQFGRRPSLSPPSREQRRRDARHRRRDPRQPRDHAHAGGRAQRQPSRRHRPDVDARRGAAPRRAPERPAHRHRRHRTPSRGGGVARRAEHRARAPAAHPPARARHGAGLGSAQPRPGRPARPRLPARRHRGIRARSAAPWPAPTNCRTSSLKRARRSPRPATDLAEALAAILADDLPLSKRDGGFVRARLRRRPRRGARARPRFAPLHRRAAGPLRRRDRLPHAAHQAQRHARLFRRGAAGGRRGFPQTSLERDLRPPPDHGRLDALLEPRPRRARGEDRLGDRPLLKPRARHLRRPRCTRRRARGPDRGGRRGGRGRRRHGGARRAGREP